MKRLLLLLLSIFFLLQQGHPMKKQFLRVFDLNGKKIAAGFLYQTTDSSIILKKGGEYKEIAATRIGVIKKGRSTLRTVIIVILVLPLIILFIVYLIMLISNAISGKSNRSLADDSKASNTYTEELPAILEVFGDIENWHKQKLILDRVIQHSK